MNFWTVVLSVGLISGSIFLASAPQREVARRELERQDAADASESNATATQIRHVKQANEFLEQARGPAK